MLLLGTFFTKKIYVIFLQIKLLSHVLSIEVPIKVSGNVMHFLSKGMVGFSLFQRICSLLLMNSANPLLISLYICKKLLLRERFAMLNAIFHMSVETSNFES